MVVTRTIQTDDKGLFVKVEKSIYRPMRPTTITVGDIVQFAVDGIYCWVRALNTEQSERWGKRNG